MSRLTKRTPAEVERIVAGAQVAGERPDLRLADLRGVGLSWANLSWANLSWANLYGANLRLADLRLADLRLADLSWANLSWANLSWANLYGANLRLADLRGANLRGANLSGANLRLADLRGVGQVLSVTGLHHDATLQPLPEGIWHLRIGCWGGTTTDLRELIAKDAGWPESTGDEIAQRRPILAALADMCDAWAATKRHELDAVVKQWGPGTGVPS